MGLEFTVTFRDLMVGFIPGFPRENPAATENLLWRQLRAQDFGNGAGLQPILNL